MKQPVLAVDVGGSAVKLGVVADGQLAARATCAARPKEGLAATLNDIAAGLAVGAYTIRPHGSAEATECVTVKAFVRPEV